MRAVRVKWVDSANHAIGWEDSTKHSFSVIESVGFVAEDDDEGITLIQSFCKDGPGVDSVNNAISIPKGCIRRIDNV